MLGVFRRDLNQQADPLTPELPDSKYQPALKYGYLERQFASLNSPCVIVKLGNDGFLAYSTGKDLSPNPRPMFCLRGGIYCICRCSMEMMELKKEALVMGDESDLLVDCYKDLVKQGNNTPFGAMQKYLDGEYNFILYDSFAYKEGPGRHIIALNCWDNTPLYYGLDSEGTCIISDCFDVMGKVCGELKSIKDLPKGYLLRIPLSIPVADTSLGYNVSENESAKETSEANPLGGSSISVAAGSKDELTTTKFLVDSMSTTTIAEDPSNDISSKKYSVSDEKHGEIASKKKQRQS